MMSMLARILWGKGVRNGQNCFEENGNNFCHGAVKMSGLRPCTLATHKKTQNLSHGRQKKKKKRKKTKKEEE